jgi:hypothetical protein
MKNMVTLALVAVLLLAVPVTATAEVGDVSDQYVLGLINQYRSAPFAHAVALGYDPAYLAEKGIGPETWLAPYETDEILCAAAAEANSQAGAPGRDDRMAVTHNRQQTIQTGSVLTFSNFIPVETAGTFFVQNLMRNELNTGDFKYMLSSEFSYAGVSMESGVLNGLNAWFSSLVLGSSARIEDIQILNLINQVRAEPYLVPLSVSTDFLELFRQNQRIYQLPGMQFQPVFFNEQLFEQAVSNALISDELNGVPATPENLEMTAGAQEAVNTYPGGFFDTVSARVSWKDMTDARIVTDLFSALLVNEFSTWPYGAIIFSNYYNQAGIFISVEPGELLPNPEPWKPLLQPGIGTVSYVGGSENPQPVTEPGIDMSQIYGLVFTDHDGDYIYAPGDEVVQQSVEIYDIYRNPVTGTITDNAGHFSVSLAPGDYWFETWQADQLVQRLVHVETDLFVKLGFSPVPDKLKPVP